MNIKPKTEKQKAAKKELKKAVNNILKALAKRYLKDQLNAGKND